MTTNNTASGIPVMGRVVHYRTSTRPVAFLLWVVYSIRRGRGQWHPSYGPCTLLSDMTSGIPVMGHVGGRWHFRYRRRTRPVAFQL